jgi:hypothetical protein
MLNNTGFYSNLKVPNYINLKVQIDFAFLATLHAHNSEMI